MCFTGEHGELPHDAGGGRTAGVLCTKTSIAVRLGCGAPRLQEKALPSTLLALMLLGFSPSIAITEFFKCKHQ